MRTHYTGTVEAVENILTYGFGWMPRRRQLAKLLIPQRDYTRREPQQFGMISFTELEPKFAKAHCEKFGYFGIQVSDAWARSKGAQRVIYIEEDGPLTDAMRALFAAGYADVTSRIRYPEDGGWLMAYENKNAARTIAGSTLWANLLQLWEYLEPASSSEQQEWRIVNPDPYYTLSENKTEAIARISPPQNWAKHANVTPIPRSEVDAIVCRASDHDALLSKLPREYNDVVVIQTAG